MPLSDTQRRQYLIARLLISGGTKLLREKFDSIHKPNCLYWLLNESFIKTQLKEILTSNEWHVLYSQDTVNNISSADFNLRLILKLLTTICGLKPPVTGWSALPQGVSFEDDLARIECYCAFLGYEELITDIPMYVNLWGEISQAFLRIAASISSEKRSEWEITIGKILQTPPTFPEADNYVKELRSWEVRSKRDTTQLRGLRLLDGVIVPAGGALAVVAAAARGEVMCKVEVARGHAMPLGLFSPETAGNLNIPREILARGPLALEIYSNALKDGKTIENKLPIMLVGQAHVGKTSLKKSLKGDPFNAKEQSTIGIEVDPSYCRVTREIWRPERSNQTTCSESAISFDYHAAQLIARGLTVEKETSEITSGEPIQGTNNIAIESEIAGACFSQETRTASGDTGHKQEEHETAEMPRHLVKLTHKFLSKDNELNEEDEIHSVLWDFGGQSVYYVTHPLFLTSRAIYLLVYDLSRNPDDKANPVRRRGLFAELEDSFSSKTNLEYLDWWMRSVTSLVSHDDELPTIHPSEKLPEKLPPVLLVCTHADQPYDGRDPTTIAAEIMGCLQGKSYSSHLFDGVFAVDNTRSGSRRECPEVVRLRSEILALAKELPQMNVEIPLKWLKFEKELQAKIEQGHKWISLEEARQVAFEVCHISHEEEFVTLLKFLHDQRIIIHFDDTPSLNQMVVLDIQWLIDVFKKVITIHPYNREGGQYKDLWLKLEKTGILEEKLLEYVWGPLYDHKETSKSLIEIMEKFSLLCSWPSTDERKQYLVPSMLMSHPPEDIIRLVESSHIPPLYLTFNSSQVPFGLFPRIVLQIYQWCSKEWPSPCKPRFYQNFARFHICPDEGCSVILLCHSSFIEIVVHRPNDEVGDDDLSERLQTMAMTSCPNLGGQNPDLVVARAVRRQLGLMLECMPKEFVWLRDMECEMKVLCSVCCSGGSVEYCEDHRIKNCKREECLHFWSEAQLQSGQQFCDRSAVSADPRINNKMFVPWFSFLDDQEQAIDGSAAKELLSAEEEEAKALVLSTGILNSLQSACEPGSVVAQLQESLEINQAALTDPAPDTTRLIRSLAVIAKRENRLDVVQHLRQITPAGTTGPLLPERLDVKAIPLPQMKALTFSLSGGDEWTLLADKLGLTPAEIRYLNNRTMNPSLEAIGHIRNERFINVDTLYNALVECGLPVLADLL